MQRHLREPRHKSSPCARGPIPATTSTTTTGQVEGDLPSGEPANIKVMSFNLQADYKTESRISNALTIINEYPCDVYCFQEANTWGDDIGTLGQLTLVKKSRVASSDVHIYYNKETLKLLDGGVNQLTYRGEVFNGVAAKHTTYFSYAVFEHIETQKQFLVINIHLDYDDTSSVVRRASVNAIFDKMDTDLAKYKNLPMILVGDTNSDYQTGKKGNGGYQHNTDTTFTYLNTKVGLKWAYQMDGVEFITENVPNFHWYSGEPYTLINNAFRMEFPNDGTAEDLAEQNGWGMDKRILDFIFVSNNGAITPKTYEVIYRNFATKEGYWKYASDHMPITCEMTIN